MGNHQGNSSNYQNKHSLSKKGQNFSEEKRWLVCKVLVGNAHKLISCLGNSTFTVPGNSNEIPSQVTWMVEKATHHNLPVLIGVLLPLYQRLF